MVQIWEVYRAYESSNVSVSAQAWTIFTVCTMAVADLLLLSVALGDSRVPTGSASHGERSRFQILFKVRRSRKPDNFGC